MSTPRQCPCNFRALRTNSSQTVSHEWLPHSDTDPEYQWISMDINQWLFIVYTKYTKKKQPRSAFWRTKPSTDRWILGVTDRRGDPNPWNVLTETARCRKECSGQGSIHVSSTWPLGAVVRPYNMCIYIYIQLVTHSWRRVQKQTASVSKAAGNMSIYVNTCQYMSIYVNICQCVPNIHWGTPFSDKPILYIYDIQIDSYYSNLQYIITTWYLCTSSQVNVISQLWSFPKYSRFTEGFNDWACLSGETARGETDTTPALWRCLRAEWSIP